MGSPIFAPKAALKKTIVVGVGDMAVSNDAMAELITYSLGSCIGLVAYDPVRKVGGMLHFMLPDSNISATKASERPAMFADTGIPRLFHAIYTLGGEKSRLIVKMAGGAELMDTKRVFNIGARNVRAACDLLAKNGVVIHGQDLGGHESRTVRIALAGGRTTVATPGKELFEL